MQGKPRSRRLLALSLAAALGLVPLAALAQAPAPATPAQPTAPSVTPAPPKAMPAPDKNVPQAATPEPKPTAPSATPAPGATLKASPPAVAPATPPAAAPKAAPPAPLAPGGAPRTQEIEPNGSPQTPGSATMETIQVPARPIVFVEGQSSYDDAFKSIKASLAKVKAAMDKAGLKPSGHPITIFVDTDDKGFKYKAAIPIAAKPEGKSDLGKSDLGDGVSFGESPAGGGLKFRHRGPFDEIDSTYDLIVAYLDEKGLQIDPPYIEEYLTDLTTPDDPNLEVDIYTFVKK